MEKVAHVTMYPLNGMWYVVTEFENSIEERKFTSQANAVWHMENMLGRM